MAYDTGQGIKGGVGGAMAGFSVGGPLGAVIGGGLGLLGGFGGGESEQQKANRKRLEDFYNSVRNRDIPQAGPASTGDYSGFRNNQRNLISMLEAQAQGRGPSVAGQQLKAALDQNSAQQQSLAASGRGGPLAAQMAANNIGRLGAQTSQDAATARVAEQATALNQLGLTVHGARGADEEMNRFNAGQKNEVMMGNLAARLKAMGQNDDAILRALGAMSGNANAQAAIPGLGDQIMAGGAGMFMQGATQRAGAKGGGPGGGFGGYGPIGASWKALL